MLQARLGEKRRKREAKNRSRHYPGNHTTGERRDKPEPSWRSVTREEMRSIKIIWQEAKLLKAAKSIGGFETWLTAAPSLLFPKELH